MKKPIIIEQLNGVHPHNVLQVRRKLDDMTEGRALRQAEAQLRRPVRAFIASLNERLLADFNTTARRGV